MSNYLDRHDLLLKIADYIRKEHTGNLEQFARELNLPKDKLYDDISRDRLHDYIETLRLFLAREFVEILYDRKRNTYYFEPSGRLTGFKFIKSD